MITALYPNSGWIEINPNVSTPYIPSSSNPMQGVLRCMNNRYEVWDGTIWQSIGGSSSVDLSPQAKMVMDWSFQKMSEEARIKHLAQDHPAVAEAQALVRHAEERLKIVVALTQENKNEMV